MICYRLKRIGFRIGQLLKSTRISCSCWSLERRAPFVMQSDVLLWDCLSMSANNFTRHLLESSVKQKKKVKIHYWFCIGKRHRCLRKFFLSIFTKKKILTISGFQLRLLLTTVSTWACLEKKQVAKVFESVENQKIWWWPWFFKLNIIQLRFWFCSMSWCCI